MLHEENRMGLGNRGGPGSSIPPPRFVNPNKSPVAYMVKMIDIDRYLGTKKEEKSIIRHVHTFYLTIKLIIRHVHTFC